MTKDQLDQINATINSYAGTGFHVPVSVELLKLLVADVQKLQELRKLLCHAIVESRTLATNIPTEFELMLRASPPKTDTVPATVTDMPSDSPLIFNGKASFRPSFIEGSVLVTTKCEIHRDPLGKPLDTFRSTQVERNMRQSGLASTPRIPCPTLLGYPVVMVDEAELLRHVVVVNMRRVFGILNVPAIIRDARKPTPTYPVEPTSASEL